VQKIVQFFSPDPFISFYFKQTMENCVFCGDKLCKKECDVCKNCFSFLKSKYPKIKCLKEVIKWHKENIKEIQEEQDEY